MAQKQLQTAPALTAENIGGIDHTQVDLADGVTVLTGRNATNRTSLMQAIMAAMGSDNVSLKGDADEGFVELELGDERYTRTLTRTGDRIETGGDPYMDDPELADLFAFLLETNDCREAVARNDDLREILMRPIDTDEIERDIRRLEEQKEEIGSELAELDSLKRELPDLEAEKRRLEEEIAENEAIIESRRADLEDADKTVEESRQENQELDEKMELLKRTRDEHSSVEQRIESERESVAALEAEIEEKRAELEETSPVSDDCISHYEQEIRTVRRRIEMIDETTSDLQSVIEYNEEFLSDHQSPSFGEPAGDEGTDVTEKLLEDSEDVTCWTCGTNVARSQIESNVDQLRSLRERRLSDRQSLEAELEALEAEKEALEDQQERYERLDETIYQLEYELDERRDSLESLTEEEAKLANEIETLREQAEALQSEQKNKAIEIHGDIKHSELMIDQSEDELAAVEDEIARLEERLSRRDGLEARLAETKERLEERRTRVETLQSEAVEQFNEHMGAVLELLDYDGLERIWIERTRESVRDGRQTVEKDSFDINVVRRTDEGTVYEDELAHLSESEREITGLVFSLAGYVVYEVHEKVPFMLLDSVEAIDPDRICRLVDYLSEYADHLIVALLEDDAAALEADYPTVTSI